MSFAFNAAGSPASVREQFAGAADAAIAQPGRSPEEQAVINGVKEAVVAACAAVGKGTGTLSVECDGHIDGSLNTSWGNLNLRLRVYSVNPAYAAPAPSA